MKGPFSESKLRELAENVIEQQDAIDHEDASGKRVLFLHHDVKLMFDPQISLGKDGEFYKFKYEYELEVVEEEYPDEPYKARYHRTIRINSKGKVAAIGDRILLEELD